MSQPTESTCFSPKGDLIIDTVAEHTKMFLWCSQETSDILLDLSHVDRFDTSGLQLLFSLKRYCQENKKSLLIQPVSDSVKRFLEFFSLSAVEFEVLKEV